MRAVLLLCLALGHAAAQTTPRDSGVARVLTRFHAGQPIRIALLSARWAGAYLGQRGDTVFLGRRNMPPDTPPMAVRFNAVDTAWRYSRATRRGAKVGAFVGAASGFALGGPGGAVFGGAIDGAIIGALIGSAFRGWRVVYP
jgi:hypothetical protein